MEGITPARAGWLRIGGILILLATHVAVAQDSPEPVPAATEDSTVEGEAPAAAPVVPKKVGDIGDVFHLKTGGQVIGQFVSKRSGAYQIEIISGVTISVPISQVTSIDYDPYDVYEARQRLETARSGQQNDAIASTKLSPELSRKMNAPISESAEPLVVPFDNLVGVLEHLAKHCDVTIQIGEGVRNLPPDKLRWEGTIAPKTTLYGLFQDTILPKYRDVVSVNFQLDKIVVTLPQAPEAAKTE